MTTVTASEKTATVAAAAEDVVAGAATATAEEMAAGAAAATAEEVVASAAAFVTEACSIAGTCHGGH
jgi:hypothetical protein